MDRDELAVLDRWLASGGTARIERRSAGRLELGLFTCTGDERMGGLVITDPGLFARVEALAVDGEGDE